MRANFFLSTALLVFSGSVLLMSGCNYNVSSPMYDQPSPYKVTPAITSIDPASEAPPGVNLITIHGHNLMIPSADTLTPGSTVVYFNSTVTGIIVSIDSTSIVVRRPNVSGDSCTIAVEPHNGASSAVFGPYKIDPVIARYGGFLQTDLVLGAIAVDNSENLYVVEYATGAVHKVTPDGSNVVIGGSAGTTGSPLTARIGPDDNLYVLRNKSRVIEKLDLSSGAATAWATFASGLVTTGDFGPGGYFYVGGVKTDLRIVAPNPPASPDTLDASKGQYSLAHSYASDTITAVRVFGGDVYVITGRPAKIWKNHINADASVGAREPVIDMSTTSFSSDPVTGIAFSSTGTMFLSTNSRDPILVVNPSAGTVDNFYQGIVPSYCPGMSWSMSSNYLYLISGYTPTGAATPLQPWTVYQLDMGATGGSGF